jgi:hypothetical protein
VSGPFLVARRLQGTTRHLLQREALAKPIQQTRLRPHEGPLPSRSSSLLNIGCVWNSLALNCSVIDQRLSFPSQQNILLDPPLVSKNSVLPKVYIITFVLWFYQTHSAKKLQLSHNRIWNNAFASLWNMDIVLTLQKAGNKWDFLIRSYPLAHSRMRWQTRQRRSRKK